MCPLGEHGIAKSKEIFDKKENPDMKQQYTFSLVNHKIKISSACHVSEVVGVSSILFVKV